MLPSCRCIKDETEAQGMLREGSGPQVLTTNAKYMQLLSKSNTVANFIACNPAVSGVAVQACLSH